MTSSHAYLCPEGVKAWVSHGLPRQATTVAIHKGMAMAAARQPPVSTAVAVVGGPTFRQRNVPRRVRWVVEEVYQGAMRQ